MKTRPNPFLRTASLTAVIAFCFASSAHAVTQYWTGSGTWNTGTNWSNTSGGTYNVAWNNITADIAVFEGFAGTVNIGANRNVANLTFNTTGYSLTGSSVTLTGPSAISVNLGANVNASIGNGVTFTTSGSNTSFNLNGLDQTTNTLDLSGTIKNTTANNNGINGITVNLKTGGLIQSANSIFLGANNAGASALGATLAVDGGSFSMSNATGSTNFIIGQSGTNSSTLTIKNGGTFSFANAATTGGVRFGSGSSAATTQLTGTINLDGGTLETSKIYMGGSYTGGSSYNATVNFNGGTLKALQNNTSFLTGIIGNGAIVKSGGAKFDSNGKAITVAQVLQSGVVGPAIDGGLTLNDTAVSKGTLTLSGANTYTGATTISAGTLSAGNIVVSGGSSNLGNATSAVTLGAASTQGTLSYTGSSAIYTRGFTIGGAGGGRLDVTTSGQTLQVDTGGVTGSGLFTVGGAGNTSIGANLTHTGGLTKADAGTLTLSGTNAFTGGVSVNGGILSFSSQANSGNGNLGSLAAAKTITLGGGTLSYTGSATISSNNLALSVTANSVLEVTDSAATLRSGGTLSGTGQLTINGPGVVALGQNAANAAYGKGFTGDIVVSNGATLSLRNQNSMGSDSLGVATGTTTVQNGGTLLLDPFSQTSISYNSETIAFQGSSTLTNRLNGQNSLSTAITGSVSTAGTLTVNTREDVLTSNAVSLELSGAITGNGGVNFGTTGGRSGTYIISNNSNGYLGATNVKSGTLVVNGNISTSSLTTVESGAALGGSGTVGDLTILAGGSLNPGNSPGQLTVNGNYSQAGTLNIEVNGLTAGTQHDQVNVLGTVTLGGILSTSFSGFTPANGNLIFILLNDGADAISSTFFGLAQNDVVTSFGGFDWKISYTANSSTGLFSGGNDIALMAVPEPRAALIGGLGLITLFRRRRNR